MSTSPSEGNVADSIIRVVNKKKADLCVFLWFFKFKLKEDCSKQKQLICMRRYLAYIIYIDP